MIIGGMSCLMESVWFGGHLGVYTSYKLRERKKVKFQENIWGKEHMESVSIYSNRKKDPIPETEKLERYRVRLER